MPLHKVLQLPLIIEQFSLVFRLVNSHIWQLFPQSHKNIFNCYFIMFFLYFLLHFLKKLLFQLEVLNPFSIKYEIKL